MWELWKFVCFFFNAIWARLHPDFNSHAFVHCAIFSGKKGTASRSHASPKVFLARYGCSWTVLQLFSACLTRCCTVVSVMKCFEIPMLSFHYFPSFWQFCQHHDSSSTWDDHGRVKLSYYTNGGNIKTTFAHSWKNIVSVNWVRTSYTSFKS